MACFLAPLAESVAVSAVKKCVEKKEGAEGANGALFSEKLGWLNKMLYGGSFLLAIEHVWHGEVVPWPPFLTAMNNPADVAPMLGEIATVGVSMAVLITAVWCVMVLVSARIERGAAERARG